MKILSNAFGEYQTNCYIVKNGIGELIIDPGKGAYEWVVKNIKNPVAIICTHGHFDHIFDVAKLKCELNLVVFIHKDDAFMLQSDPFGYGYEICEADFKVDEGVYERMGFEFEFMHFAGHTPGCCMVRVGGDIFSGDFLFKSSIGRWDFEYSSKDDMIKSLKKCKSINGDFALYPGHAEPTTLKAEQENLDRWIRYVSLN